MNATEQQTHRTVTQGLQQQIRDLVTVTEELDQRDQTLAADAVVTRREVNELRAALERNRNNLATAFERIAEVRRDMNNVHGRDFWGRLRWLVRGT